MVRNPIRDFALILTCMGPGVWRGAMQAFTSFVADPGTTSPSLSARPSGSSVTERSAGASRALVAKAYLGKGRAMHPGEAVTAKNIEGMLKAQGARKARAFPRRRPLHLHWLGRQGRPPGDGFVVEFLARQCMGSEPA